MSLVCVSGGFDPLHDGHVDMMEEAAQHGNLLVILNSDAWLLRKKGYIFMPFKQRAKIIRALRCVDGVAAVDDTDGTVCKALELYTPDFFANGGDRKQENTPEMEVCAKLGIKLLFDVGGGKSNSSSELVARAGNR